MDDQGEPRILRGGSVDSLDEIRRILSQSILHIPREADPLGYYEEMHSERRMRQVL